MSSEAHKKTEPSKGEFESLFVNNSALSKIEAHIQRFNPIKVMKMENMEIRHSAILAWLFDPRESHGLEDKFLKAFLGEALRGHETLEGVSALDVSRADLRDAIVRTEWHHIDLFVSCDFEQDGRTNTWAFVIENKFRSKQYKGQLTKYREKIETIFDIHNVTVKASKHIIKLNGIFLTLHEEPPEDTSFASIHYSDVVTLLGLVIEQNSHSLTLEVSTFLTHYVKTLNEATGMSKTQTEMEKLAREIYLEHKKVIDFVVEHGASTDFAFAARAIFDTEQDENDVLNVDGEDFYYGYLSNSDVSFLPKSWADAFDGESDKGYDWPGCEDWWMEYPIITWLRIRQGNSNKSDGKSGEVRLYAEVGRLSDHKHRKLLIEKIKLAASEKNLENIKFQAGAEKEGRKYSKFFKQNSKTVKDVHDSEEIEKAMRALLKKFRPEFEAIGEAINGFHQYGKANKK